MIDITKIQTFDIPASLKTMQINETAMKGKIKILRFILGFSAVGLFAYYLYRKKKKNEQ
jgi:hypothetical protein